MRRVKKKKGEKLILVVCVDEDKRLGPRIRTSRCDLQLLQMEGYKLVFVHVLILLRL